MRIATLTRFGALSFVPLLVGCTEVREPVQPGLPQFAVVSISSVDLGTLGGGSSQAVAINHSGQVVGSSSTPSDFQHAFLWENGTMRDLGTLGGTLSAAVAINDAGRVAGNSTLSTGRSCPSGGVPDTGCRAFLWDGTMQDLGTLGGDLSEATAMNAAGHVVGVSLTASGESHAFLWDGTTMHDLGTLGGDLSFALAVNAAGKVAGVSATAVGEFHAFLWDGVMRDLGTLGGNYSAALAINPRGDVVGVSNTVLTPGGNAHAFLWDGTTMHDLGTLGGTESYPLAINPRGDVVGYAARVPGDLAPHPFLWNGTTMLDLGTLGGLGGRAIAVNEAGRVVGEAGVGEFGTCTAHEGCHAFYWDGSIHDLGTLGGLLSSAVDLNARGQVVGWSLTTSEARHAVLWTVR